MPQLGCHNSSWWEVTDRQIRVPVSKRPFGVRNMISGACDAPKRLHDQQSGCTHQKQSSKGAEKRKKGECQLSARINRRKGAHPVKKQTHRTRRPDIPAPQQGHRPPTVTYLQRILWRQQDAPVVQPALKRRLGRPPNRKVHLKEVRLQRCRRE